jgi:hypothetical protein
MAKTMEPNTSEVKIKVALKCLMNSILAGVEEG